MTRGSPDAAIAVGSMHVATFWPNREEADGKPARFRVRATHLGGIRAPKVVLSADPRITPGQPCRVRIKAVHRLDAPRRGYIEVEFVSGSPLGFEEGIYVDPSVARKLQVLLELGKNVLLDGPQGCGKTVLSRHVARALGVEYVYFNAAYVHDAMDFVASLQLRATPGGGHETVWLPTDIHRAIQRAHAEPELRTLIFLDELNRCREMARNGIMPALDSTRRIYDPFTNSTIAIPESVQWIAAINTGSQFTGTTPIDPAQLDRFAPLKLTYPPPAEERRLLALRHPEVAPAAIERVVRAADALRANRELPMPVSMRATEEVVAMLSHPLFVEATDDPLPDLLKTSFCGRLHGHWNDDSTDAGIAWQLLVRTLGF